MIKINTENNRSWKIFKPIKSKDSNFTTVVIYVGRILDVQK